MVAVAVGSAVAVALAVGLGVLVEAAGAFASCFDPEEHATSIDASVKPTTIAATKRARLPAK